MTSPHASLAERIADLLVEASRLDSDAIDALVRLRVSCNQQLANHSSIQVHGSEDENSVGLLGILNGLLPGEQRVAGIFDKATGRLIGFRMVGGFEKQS